MTLFELVKQNICVPDAAEHYGLQSRYNLEYCNNVTNAAGRRVRGFLGIEVLVRNNMSVFSGDSMRTYVPEDVPEEWRR